MFEYRLGINSDGREMFIPLETDITATYQYKFGNDPWVSPLLSLKSKYKLTSEQFEELKVFLAQSRAKDSAKEKHKDHYQQMLVKFIKDELL
jgi:hypothetical protein